MLSGKIKRQFSPRARPVLSTPFPRLSSARKLLPAPPERQGRRAGGGIFSHQPSRRETLLRRISEHRPAILGSGKRVASAAGLDRKSVVEGKRVDLGGCGYIQ